MAVSKIKTKLSGYRFHEWDVYVLFLWLSHSTAKLWLDSDVRFIDTELRPTVAVVVLLQESPLVNLNSQRFIKKVTSSFSQYLLTLWE